MSRHLQTGKRGEQLAADWLKHYGFCILHINWRHSHYEIDIIAEKSEILHFVEVKTRSGNQYGNPEESVSQTKFTNLINAAEEFLYQNQQWKKVQFDILSISYVNGYVEYYLIEDVYM
jgi:putative endonuclease